MKKTAAFFLDSGGYTIFMKMQLLTRSSAKMGYGLKTLKVEDFLSVSCIKKR